MSEQRTMTFRVPDEMQRAVVAAARHNFTNPSTYIRQRLAEALRDEGMLPANAEREVAA